MKHVTAHMPICLFALTVMLASPLVAPADDFDDLPCRFPPAARIVAIGDVHGDLEATQRAFRLAGAIDEEGNWIGGDLVVVQVGDQIDRGDEEQDVLDWLQALTIEARQSGGALHVLNGNHELMNAKLDLRYVTPAGYLDFEDAVEVDDADSLLTTFEEEQRARVAAFRPGGPYARLLAERNVAIIVGETVFVHGGLVPEHAEYGLERMNREVRSWLLGLSPEPELFARKGSPVWDRHYSDEVDEADCSLLARTLEILGARRMVVGHTVQEEGITSYCGGAVWCIDVGIARHYGGELEVLEIMGGQVRTLSEEHAATGR
jgi:hypothetical protein